MMNKNKLYILAAVAVVAALFVITALNRSGEENNLNESNSDNFKNSENSIELNLKENSVSENLLQGKLVESDDFNQGNLKLVSGEKSFYIKTGRNFGHLIGKEVLVLINGNEENFELVDIHSKN